ncbi:glycoside hydrolase family 6 protein [Streptomyces sp. 6N223]|uniref:glycoside hydrolase family 6 protein n=1 Tax=Streptomyces sp. 6N223 TaxID=3457412 RepID=UPI003FCFBA28
MKAANAVNAVKLALVLGFALTLAAPVSAPAANATATATAQPPNKAGNPYAGARVYTNPEWSAHAAAEPGGQAVAGEPTAVWLDRIADIDTQSDAMNLREHLDEALAQDADVVQLVLHDIPGRDCDWLYTTAELGPDELPRYREEFIDPIVEIIADPAYAELRVVAVVEPDALPNLVTFAGGGPAATAGCEQVYASGVYLDAIGYALSRLGPLPNAYPYLDIGHHGRLGFDDTLREAAGLAELAAGASGSSPAYVHGLATNVADYSATREPYFSVDDVVDGVPVREGSSWLAGNAFADELPYARAFREALIARGFDEGLGVLIDTSRNGWGGPDRPTGPGPRTTAEEYVEGGRVDRRVHAANWCNQAGSGLGERPAAAPEPGVDAYAWIKPPGESDGSSIPLPIEGGGYSPMCDPTYGGGSANAYNPTGALPNAPLNGEWFPAHFQELLANAWPPA